jgi:hypothetical protein
MDIKKKYRWFRQENGKYTIRAVEIFGVFEDKDRGDAVTEETLHRIVADTGELHKRGQYQRVFLGHHESFENKTGVGFLDSLFVNGETLFSDIVEVPECIFMQIMDLRYPYRSAEFSKGKLVGVALLESQQSYFPFPILSLAESGDETTDVDNEQVLVRYQLMSFWSKPMNEEKKDDEKKEEDVKEEGEKKEEDKFSEFSPESALKEISSAIADLKKSIEILIGMEKKEEDTEPSGGEEEKNPSSVAYQLNQMKKKIDALEGREKFSVHEKQLREVCERSGLNFVEQQAILSKFSSDSDRTVYLGSLTGQGFPRHPMTKKLGSMSGSAINAGETLIQKFSAQSDRDGQIARKALQIYIDTCTQASEREVKRFQAIWGDSPERFVSHVVEESKIDAKYIEKITSV